jgi:hypothetical protein
MEVSFINITSTLTSKKTLIGEGQIKANVISPEEALRKSAHFSRLIGRLFSIMRTAKINGLDVR